MRTRVRRAAGGRGVGAPLRRAGVTLAALALGAVAGCGGGTAGRPAAHDAVRTFSAAPASTTPGAAPTGQLGSHPAKLAELQAVAARAPVRLVVPDLKVDAPIQSVGTDPATHGMSLPSDATHVAWWSLGARPGDAAGTMVLAAHVDWNHVEGLFFHLGTLRRGAVVTVVTAGGARQPYRVISSHRLPKLDLSSQDLFTRAGSPRLVLVTCGGAFNYAAHSYLDNVIVYTEPVR